MCGYRARRRALGLTPRDVAMNVALPEFDGRLITTAVSFKDAQTHDAALQTEVLRYQPRPDRVAHVADLARNWARLRQTANADKRIAILLANYPSKNARVGKGAKVTLVEAYAGASTSPRHRNAVTRLLIEDGAEVRHLYQAETNDGSVHLAHLMISMGAHATYKPFVLTSGNGLTRNDLSVMFTGQHSTFDLGGLALGTNASHADMTLVVDHAVPHCTSRELYHSVLGGEAKSVFQGKVIVRRDAQKTDGKQMARALMLSPNAEFDSKPELEIYADDVICGHGSTSVEIDADMLFYCRSRGIPLAEARPALCVSG